MAKTKTEQTPKGEKHFSVGCLIKREGKYLLIDRKIYPPGLASPAGHIDEGETPEQAAQRELREEVGLSMKSLKQVFHEDIPWNECHHGITHHEWWVFDCAWSGKVDPSYAETKGAAWMTPEEIKENKDKLEKVWKHIFETLGVI